MMKLGWGIAFSFMSICYLLLLSRPAMSSDTVLLSAPENKLFSITTEKVEMEKRIADAQAMKLLSPGQSAEARRELDRIVQKAASYRASGNILDWDEVASVAHDLGRLNARIRVTTRAAAAKAAGVSS